MLLLVNKSLIFALFLSFVGIFTQMLFGFQGGVYQIGFTVAGIIIYFAIVKKVDLTALINSQFLISLIGLASLVALLLIGDPTRGAKRWFFIFGFGLQPSMIFVPFFLLTLCILIIKKPLERFTDVLRALLLSLVPVLLIFKQPDLGTSLVLFGTAGIVLLSAHLKLKHLFVLLLIVVPIVISAPKLLKPYQRDRLISFLNPHLDQYGTNYNSLQAEIAIGSGGLLGKGFLSGTQSKLSFLPEAHTDFVFASYTETFGFVGVAILLFVYFLFLKSLLPPAGDPKKLSLVSLYSIGVFGFIFVQFFFNVGMNLRLLPIVGVPLPFISYGGSSVLAIYTLLGVKEKLREI